MRKLQDKIKSQTIKTDFLSYACAQMQGWRPNMEDAFISGINNVCQGISLFAVFDGHGGSHVSKFLQEHFIQILKQQLQFKTKQFQIALEKTFQQLDKQLIGQYAIKKMASYKNGNKGEIKKDQTKIMQSTAIFTGSTANIVLITNQKIYIGNCGDSRSAMFLSNPQNQNCIFDKYIQLSQDHKPDTHTEKQRIEKAGGFVEKGRVNANLSLSRAFGDFYYKANNKIHFKQQMIISHPQIKIFPKPSTKFGQLNFILIGCDGIWERFQSNSAGLLQLVKFDLQFGQGLEKSLKNLLNLLVSRNAIQTQGKGCDNMTAILIKFQK